MIMALESKLIRPGSWVKIQIISISYGFCQRLENGKWENTTREPQRIESEILTFAECFSNEAEAEVFLKTKKFKSLFKFLEKTWK